jgi:elongation factor Ts
MAISSQEVQKLREETGVAIIACKKALEEANGDFAKACELLKERNAMVAAKKADREASEGLIEAYIHGGGKIGVMVEVNCETDFVARNEDFKAFAKELVMQVAAAAPEYVTPEEVPAELVEKEKEIELEQLKDSGKPKEVLDKIIEGKINKFYGGMYYVNK